jgi:hypothetical protein
MISVKQMVECLAGKTEVLEESCPICRFVGSQHVVFIQFSEVLFYELFVMFVSVSQIKNTDSTIS